MTKEKKEQIINEYVRSIKRYLHIGLCVGEANGSYGEDLMEHFDIMANDFKEIKLLEHDLGIDLVTLFKALKDGIWIKEDKDQFLPYHCLLRDDLILVLYDDIYKHEYLLKDYGKTWALDKKDLTNE